MFDKIFKKKISKKNDIVQKGGGGLRKKSNFECVNKNDILIGGEGVKTNVTFSRCFKNKSNSLEKNKISTDKRLIFCKLSKIDKRSTDLILYVKYC